MSETTFNCMTVDGDTSTSDTCLVFATGAAAKRGQKRVGKKGGKKLAAFSAALHGLLRDLAIQVAKDGEGLSKFVTFEVEGAKSWKAARAIGLSMRQFADPQDGDCRRGPELGPRRDGGRQVGGGCRPRQALDLVRRALRGEERRACRGLRRGVVASYMKNPEITIRVDAGVGKGRATVWTCDLTHDYVSINADYRS